MAHAPHRQPMVSRELFLGSAVLIAGTLALASLGHRTPLDPAAAGAQPVAERVLRFADRDDGAIIITDASNGHVVETLPPGTENFVRGAMRGLARERQRAAIGAEPPFRLRAWSDSRLTLEDTGTGDIIELQAFGRVNAEAFLRLLAREE